MATPSAAAVPAGSSEAAAPSPVLFWQTVNAFQQTAALRGAIELDLFTAIGEGCETAGAIAARCSASERGTRILCDYLTVVGFLAKEDGRYRLTPDSAMFLDRRSPAYMGTVVRFVNSPELMAAYNNVAEVVRRGTSLMDGAGTMEPENPIWVEFARSMVPIVRPATEFIGDLIARDLAGKIRVLDIAAGHGLFGIAIARRNPEAEIVAVDWPNVLQVAQENAAAAGVQSRYRLLPGDLFEVDYGAGYDVVLLTNIFHHFDQPACEALMRKVHSCLNPGGRAITLEFVPNEDRISPPIPATFSLMMLAGTTAGDAYTFAEYDRMFRAAGFARNELLQVPQSPQQTIVSYR